MLRRGQSSNSNISPQKHSGWMARQGSLLYDGPRIHSPTNAALLLEDIKQEALGFDADYAEGTPARTQSSSKRRYSIEGHGKLEAEMGFDSVRRAGSYSLKACKQEDESSSDNGETTFSLFASLLDSAIQGVLSRLTVSM